MLHLRRETVERMKKSYTYDYPRPALTADAVVLALEYTNYYVLLVERGQDPYAGWWALPGGFVNEGETAHRASLRELKEETGLVLPYEPDQPIVGFYDAPRRDPRGWIVTAAYLYVVGNREEVKGADDASRAEWFHVESLPQMAFDHEGIIGEAVLHYCANFKALGF